MNEAKQHFKNGPLVGIRVLDFARTPPGPMAAMILGDLGADVIKIGEPGGGRRAREEREQRGEALDHLTDGERQARTRSPIERNKRSIELDLKNPEELHIALELCRRADVLIEGFRPGVMDRLGVGYKTVHELNPQLVYCSVSGYGQTGPQSGSVGHDLNYVAFAGAISLITCSEGHPVVPPNLLADYAGGSLHAALGVMTALLARERGGTGQHVDVSMTDGVLALLTAEVSGYLSSGNVPLGGATRLTGAAPYYNIYVTKDGRRLSLGCNEPAFYRALCEALELPEMLNDQQSLDPKVTERNKTLIAERIKQRTLEEWVPLLPPETVAWSPVHRIDEAIAEEHFRARGMFVRVQTPSGDVEQVAPFLHLSETPPSVRFAAPMPDQHRAEILEELGIQRLQGSVS